MTSLKRAAFALEVRKLARAPVTRVATAASLLLVVLTTAGGYAAALYSGGTDMGRQAAAMITGPGWDGFVGLAATSVGVTDLLAVGIVMSWSIGREFTDGTIVGLFALPVARVTTAEAKMCAAACWLTLLALAQSILITISGLTLGLPWHGAVHATLTTALVAGLVSLSALPVMWIATVGRGYLAGIAATLAIVVVTNVAAGFGLGEALPWAIPVLWADLDSALDPLLLLAPLAVALAGAFLTRRTWARLELGDS